MIGDDYIEQRAELGTALYVLATLAREAGAKVDLKDLIHQLNTTLKDPFLFVVVGEVKAGKSSLLNALFGREFCRADVLPATDRVTLFRYGKKSKDKKLKGEVLECSRPIGFLKDFRIVDTPGTNTIVEGHEEITNEYLPMADLVLFVFSITNPWAASAWEFLERVQNKWMKNVAFVVQQIDLREPMEVQAVVDHLQATALERLGQKCPIFAVSAKNALLSKTTGIDKDRLWKESRFEQLEKYINETVSGGENRRGKLVSASKSGKVILNEIDTRITRLREAASQDLEQSAAIRKTMAWMRDQIASQIRDSRQEIIGAFQECQNRQATKLQRQLNIGRTLQLAFGRGRWQERFQEELETDLQETLRAALTEIVSKLQTELENVWEQFEAALKEAFDNREQALLIIPSEAPSRFNIDQEAAAQSIEEAVRKSESETLFQNGLRGMTGQTATWMRVTGLAAITGGGGAAAATYTTVPGMDLTAVIAGLVGVVSLMVTAAKRRNIIEAFHGQMQERGQAASGIVEEQLQSITQAAFAEFDTILEPLDERCQQAQENLQPLSKQLAELEATFDRLLQKLGATKAPGK